MLHDNRSVVSQLCMLYTYFVRPAEILANNFTDMIQKLDRSKRFKRPAIIERYLSLSMADISQYMMDYTHLIPWNTDLNDVMPSALQLLVSNIMDPSVQAGNTHKDNHQKLDVGVRGEINSSFFSNVLNAVIMLVYCLNFQYYVDEDALDMKWIVNGELKKMEYVKKPPLEYQKLEQIRVEYQKKEYSIPNLIEAIFCHDKNIKVKNLKNEELPAITDETRKKIDELLEMLTVKDMVETINKSQSHAVTATVFYEQFSEQEVDDKKVWFRMLNQGKGAKKSKDEDHEEVEESEDDEGKETAEEKGGGRQRCRRMALVKFWQKIFVLRTIMW